ncbi:MAG: type II secretion system protein [Pseudomonadota bacterium]
MLRSAAFSFVRAVRSGARGFTLIELIVVIVLLGILALLTTDILLKPFQGFQDQARRAKLTANADLAMQRMVRELRHALPNSVRVGCGGQCFEFLNTVDGGRYRRYPASDGTGNVLDIASADTAFDVLGGAASAAVGQQVVIYNVEAVQNVPGNAYFGNNRGAVTGFVAGALSFSPPAGGFPQHSPGQRFDLVDGPVSFYCSAGQLTRCSGYAIQTSQPASCPAGGSSSLLVEDVSSCGFSYDPGSHTRAGVMTLSLSLTDEGETISLLSQAQVLNVP